MGEILAANSTPLLIMGLLLLLSASFSGSETALFTLKPTDVNRLRRTGGARSEAVLAIRADLGRFLMTILFCNMVVNILFFATSTTLTAALATRFGTKGAVIFGILTLLTVVTVGEVAPKTVATLAGPTISRLVAIPLYALHRSLWWVRAILGGVIHLIEGALGLEREEGGINPEELRMLVEMNRSDGAISSEEHELLAEVLELPDLRARELMTPRVDVLSCWSDASAEEIVALARERGHSKIPVRDRESDEFIGWVDARELFLAEPSIAARDRIKQALIVSELDRADQILERFQQSGRRLAIVVDERGASEGIITQGDVLTEIFGTLQDEDRERAVREPIRPEGEDVYRIDGRLRVRDWLALFPVVQDIPSVTTVGGLVTALLGRPAREGDRVRCANVELEVLEVAAGRIVELRLALVREGA